MRKSTQKINVDLPDFPSNLANNQNCIKFVINSFELFEFIKP